MKSSISKIYKVIFAAALLFATAIFCFGQRELAPLEFVGASDENPDVQTVALDISPDARIEVSDESLIRAELRTEGESTRLEVAVNTLERKAGEEGTEYEGRVVVSDRDTFIIPIKIIIFPFTPRECRGRRVSVQYLTRGSFDNFVGVEATFPSPFQVATYPLQRRYDDLGTNKKYFGDSYSLGGCRVCAVRVYVRARREGEIDDNDNLWFIVSDAGNGTAYNPVNIAPPFNPMWWGQPSPYTFYREIPGSVINPEIFAKNTPMLDISSQDDTAIDYTRVYIYRY
ncbi:MAG TPA: hypothetical protein VK400_00460 [Pyrinomonadaceae bacterium]|nr:hypothetical protein [Pyrinomonadaceae bacterium]